MAAVDGAGFNLDEDVGAKISGFRKEYDNDRDGREDYGKGPFFNKCSEDRTEKSIDLTVWFVVSITFLQIFGKILLSSACWNG